MKKYHTEQIVEYTLNKNKTPSETSDLHSLICSLLHMQLAGSSKLSSYVTLRLSSLNLLLLNLFSIVSEMCSIISRNAGGIILLLMFLDVIYLVLCSDSMLLINSSWKDIGGVSEMLHFKVQHGNNLNTFSLTGISASSK